MDILYGLLLTVHVIVCVFLVIVVLLQSGKGADVAATFSMSSQTAFGPRGAATALSRATSVAVVVFMLTSIGLTIRASRGQAGTNLLDKLPAQTQPAKK
jgi:preprotein translocase subunit SecG